MASSTSLIYTALIYTGLSYTGLIYIAMMTYDRWGRRDSQRAELRWYLIGSSQFTSTLFLGGKTQWFLSIHFQIFYHGPSPAIRLSSSSPPPVPKDHSYGIFSNLTVYIVQPIESCFVASDVVFKSSHRSRGLLALVSHSLQSHSKFMAQVGIIQSILANCYTIRDTRSFTSWALEDFLPCGSPEIYCTCEIFCRLIICQIFDLILVSQKLWKRGSESREGWKLYQRLGTINLAPSALENRISWRWCGTCHLATRLLCTSRF